MTHDELVTRAARWLEGTQRCVHVVVEPCNLVLREQPDAIGWSAWGISTLVECKISRSDFHADKRKRSRVSEGRVRGMGTRRFYLTPKGLLEASCIPPGWGWAEVCGRKIFVRIEPVLRACDHEQERALLVKQVLEARPEA